MYGKTITTVMIAINLDGDNNTQENIDRLLSLTEVAGFPVADTCTNDVDLDENGDPM